MAAKYEIEKFNGNNFSLWKMKIKVVFRKNNCLAAIGEKPTEITDDKWNKIDGNVISDLYLALAGGILSSVAEKKDSKEIWDTLTKLYETKSLHNKIFLKRRLYFSNDRIYISDWPHQHLEDSIFTTPNIWS